MGKIVDAGVYRFPIFCIDNFWSDPDRVVDLANSLPFTENHSSFPGARTKELGDIAPDFNTIVINKIISLFFDIAKIDKLSLDTKHFFQKIPKFCDEKNINIGMVHQDSNDYQDSPGDMLSCIIYLNKNANLDAGTSIFEEKNLNSDYSWYNSNLDLEDKSLHNNKFIETIRFQNIYNRLVAFDSRYPHAANYFDGGSEERLTEVFFIKSLSLENNLPINRIKNFNE